MAAVAAVGAVSGFGGGGGASDDDGAAGAVPANTAEVTRQTLTDALTVDGQLGHGPATTVASRLTGTVTALPETGEEIGRGETLYAVDDRPVTLMYGAMPAYRALEPGIEGPDVRQLEENLSALGHTGFTVDEEYTHGTAEAVRQWQEDRGLEETGVVDLGRVVFAPGAVRVDGLAAAEGDPTAPGQAVLSHTSTTKAVTVALDPADQRLAEVGAAVTVTLPDDTPVDGRVAEVATVVEPGGQGEEARTEVEVVVELPDEEAQRAADAYAMAAVDVTFTAGERPDVLTVPVAALLALAEGGFGVEVVEGETSRYLPVETGLFAGGRVEVSGEGIAEGTIVGMPG
ncbi:peptidoglycan-binding protein [Allostreptomyces psammosilenae]|uniref:peptidoglycan-binding protein n=1 Tax=Allostreptomyces psammosilenae TaxID=1892865 RepID=UPI0028AF5B13|nr:peptidoglycan-binding protein [Allostreptomyces psammosilenae]